MINGVLAQVHLSVDLMGPQISLCDFFPPNSRMHSLNRCSEQLEESAIVSVYSLWSEGYYVGKGQVKAIRTISTQKNSKSKAILQTWRDCRDQCHHQGLERCKNGNLTTSQLNSLVWQNTDLGE